MGARPGVAFVISAQDDATAVLKRVEAEAGRASSNVAGVGRAAGTEGVAGLRKFENAIGNLGLASVGVHGPLGKLTEGLSLMSIGSPTFLAITGGLAAIGGALALLKGPADEAKKKVDELIESLLTAGDNSLDAQLAQLYKRQGDLRRQQADDLAQITRLQQSGLQQTIFGGRVYEAAMERVRAFNAELVRTQAAIDELESRRPKRPEGGSSDRADRYSGDLRFDASRGYVPGAVDRNWRPPAPGFRVQAPPAPELLKPGDIPEPAELIQALNMRQWAEDFAYQVSGMLADGLADGLTRAFSAAFTGEGVGGFFKQIGATMLGMLGRVFTDIGKAMVAASKLFASVRTALLTLNPGLGLAAGIGLIALGSVLGAAAGAVGGLDRGGRGGGFVSAPGGGFSGGFGAGAGVFSKPGSVVVNFTGRGPDFTDPEERDRFARMIAETGGGGTRQVTFHRIG